MSYYTTFKLKDDSSYKGKAVQKSNKLFENKDELLLKGDMIKAYYEDDLNTKFNLISCRVLRLEFELKEYYQNYYVEEINKNGEIVINHAKSESEMSYDIDDYERVINEIIEKLLILASVKFEADDRCSDTTKTPMEYLKYEYISEINEVIESLRDVVGDYVFAKFALEHCNRFEEE